MSIKQLVADIDKVNIADGLSPDKLDKIGCDVYKGFEDDETDPKRTKWAKSIEEYIELAMQVVKDKSDPWPDCANIKIPLLTEAAIQFNARSYPALVPSTNIVKCSTTGDDSQGVKSDRGDRVGKHMSYQLNNEMTEWESDMDKGLLILPLLGCFFKKTFYNSVLGRNESKLVWPQNLVMQYDAPSVDRAPRQSEIVEFYPREVEEKKTAGVWSDVEINYTDEKLEKLEKFICQHTYLDLKDSGSKIPYIVTIHKTSKKVMRIVANYTRMDIYYNDGIEVTTVQAEMEKTDKRNLEIDTGNIDALAISQKAEDPEDAIQIPKVDYPDFNKYKIVKVEATKYYTKYGFLPSPDGSIYDLGLGQLLGPLTDAADTLINQMLDAGSLANSQGGFKAKSAKAPSGTKRVAINEWVDIETTGMSLRDSILPFNFQGPSPVAFSLLAFLIDSAKAVANLKDILSGEAPQGETATTSMIKREEGMRIYNAIYKRVYRAFKAELQKLYALNAEYLPQETYFNVLDTQEAVKKTDYSFDKTDVRPVADPSESMQSQKIVKAEAGLQFVGDPEFNSYELKKRYLEAIDTPNLDEVLPPPSNEPQPPDPLLVKTTAEVQKLEAETKKLLLETAEVISKVILNLAKAEGEEVGQQIGMLEAHAKVLIQQGVGNGTNQGGVGGLEVGPDNKGGLPSDAGAGGGVERPTLLSGGAV